MKTLNIIRAALVALAGAVLAPTVNAASPSVAFVNVSTTRTSPNHFAVGQCTWFADICCAEVGRPLSFRQSYGRDAVNWPSLITGARACLAGPSASCLVVFGAPNTPSGAGHVAWVESVARDGSFTVLQVNYNLGQVVGYINGIPVVRTTFKPVGGGYVLATGGSTKLLVTAFILP